MAVVSMRVAVRMGVAVVVFVVLTGDTAWTVMVIPRQVHVKLHPGDGPFMTPRKMQVVLVERQLPQFSLKGRGFDPQIHQCANEHVAADTAENVEEQSFQCKFSAGSLAN